jgi:hypothetical protein
VRLNADSGAKGFPDESVAKMIRLAAERSIEHARLAAEGAVRRSPLGREAPLIVRVNGR